MTLADSMKSAISALRLNAMRSVLTTLGIIIGVASVIVMAAIGSGARQQVEERINALGTSVLTVSPGSSRMGGRRSGAGGAEPFSEGDLTAIRTRIPDVELMSGNLNVNAPVIAGNTNWPTQVTGVHAEFPQVRNWEIAEGDFFTARDVSGGERVAVVGATVAQNIFEGSSAVGQSIRIGGVPFTVVGVMQKRGDAGGWRDQDDIVFVPITVVRSRLGGERITVPNQVGTILIKVAPNADMAYVQDELIQLLRERRRTRADGEEDFNVRNMADIIQTRTATQTTMTWLLGYSAAISLLVGGIGIMNIMLVSVTERTREIGLRMAVGARRRDILRQFLTEAVMLCLVGGALGLTIGAAATYIIARIADWPVLISLDMVGLAVAASAAVGLIFGFFPARRAARLNPIEALRYE
jgi:putative ABC transport system permease protein